MAYIHRMKNLHLHRLIVGVLILCCLFFSVSGEAEYSFSEDADAIERAADSVFMLEVYSGMNQQIGVGSGFIALDPSLLVTNYHVIEGGAYIVAISDDMETFVLHSVCFYDKAKDIAVLRFENKPGLPALEMDGSSKLKRGQRVVAIGSPAGLMNTISTGNISAFYQRSGHDWIQFTAPISSGSSGGALFDDQGRIIGITTATYASAQNINMAVKAQDVIRLYQKWDGRTVTAMNRVNGVKAAAYTAGSAGREPENGKVYVTASGSKYHSNPNCSKMRNPKEMDLLEAIEAGYLPCGKCYK